jgi:hypothetical protein
VHWTVPHRHQLCVDGIVTDYLIDLQTPPDDARCTL